MTNLPDLNVFLWPLVWTLYWSLSWYVLSLLNKPMNRIFKTLSCPVEHVWVDSGLPAAVRLVRVRSVSCGAALWQKHAAGGESELRQPGDCSVPEAVGHLHRPGFHLRCQRVSPECDHSRQGSERFYMYNSRWFTEFRSNMIKRY